MSVSRPPASVTVIFIPCRVNLARPACNMFRVFPVTVKKTASASVLATKLEGFNDHGLSRKHTMTDIGEGLWRFQTDYVDSYCAHTSDYATSLEEALHAFDNLVRQGKVLYVGMSSFYAWKVAGALWIFDGGMSQQDSGPVFPGLAAVKFYSFFHRLLGRFRQIIRGKPGGYPDQAVRRRIGRLRRSLANAPAKGQFLLCLRFRIQAGAVRMV